MRILYKEYNKVYTVLSRTNKQAKLNYNLDMEKGVYKKIIRMNHNFTNSNS
jgi:hypothetical protein